MQSMLEHCISATFQSDWAERHHVLVFGPPGCGKFSQLVQVASSSRLITIFLDGDNEFDRRFRSYASFDSCYLLVVANIEKMENLNWIAEAMQHWLVFATAHDLHLVNQSLRDRFRVIRRAFLPISGDFA